MQWASIRSVSRANVAILLLLVITTVVVRIFGQPWWCSCGSFIPWTWETISRHNSQHLIDAYSFTHVTHGVLFFALLSIYSRRWPLSTRLVVATALECAWEILENTPWVIERYRAATISLNYYGDSILNILADVLCCIAGFVLASKLSWKASVALVLLFELLLLLLIRDNLLLNIIMLVYPVDSLRSWQQAI